MEKNSVKDTNTAKGSKAITNRIMLTASYCIAISDSKSHVFEDAIKRYFSKTPFVLELYQNAVNEKSNYAKFSTCTQLYRLP